MPNYTYRIHDEDKGDNQRIGWVGTKGYKNSINEIQEEKSSQNIIKVASSIPTIFSRPEHINNAYDFITQSKSTETNASLKLVSETLDMIELIYRFEDRISYKVWRKNRLEGNQLKSEKFKKVISYFWNQDLKFSQDKTLEEIVMIYFKDANNEEHLLGGMHPKTLFFTSPNWMQLFETKVKPSFISENPFKVLIGSESSTTYELFKDITTFENRNFNFKNYLFFLVNEYSGAIQKKAKNFYKYITGHEGYNSNNIPVEEKPLLCSVEILTKFLFRILEEERRFFNAFKINNSDKLAFNDTLKSLLRLDERDRKLIDYPVISDDWISSNDVFTPQLCKLPYEINTELFKYPQSFENYNYLLPLKEEFFDISDVENLIFEKTNDGIKIKQQLILESGRVIQLVKHYVNANSKSGTNTFSTIVDADFNIAIYPIFESDSPFWLKTWSIDKDRLPNIRLDNVDFKGSGLIDYAGFSKIYKRERQPSRIFVYDNHENILGALSISYKKPKDLTQFPKAKVAIDFGTTNTHIAVKIADAPIKSINIESVHQTISGYLSKFHDSILNEPLAEKGMSGGEDVNPSVSRAIESFSGSFIPAFLSRKTEFSFPIRTTIFHYDSDKVRGLELFFDAWVGFRYFLEHKPEYKYQLKWNIKNRELSKIFLTEILSIIRLYVESQGIRQDDIQLIYTYPHSLKDMGFFNDIWKSSISAVFNETNSNLIKELSESLAPFYYETPEYGNLFLNIDIGGGSTDIFFIDKDVSENPSLSSSLALGADYIWGNGNEARQKSKENGFIKLYRRLKEKNGENNGIGSEILFNAAIDEKIMAQDFFASIFGQNSKNLTTKHFIDELKHSVESDTTAQRTAIFFHLVSIIQYTAQLIKLHPIEKENKDCIIQFTGNGSKYLQYLEIKTKGSKSLEEVIRLLFKKFGVLNINFSLSEMPQEKLKIATAEGALNYITDYEKQNINFDENPVFLDGRTSGGNSLGNHYTIGQDKKSEYVNSVKEYISKSTLEFFKVIEDNDVKQMIDNHFSIELEIVLNHKADIEKQINKDVEKITLQIIRGREVEDLLSKVGVELTDAGKIKINSSPFCWIFQNMFYHVAGIKN